MANAVEPHPRPGEKLGIDPIRHDVDLAADGRQMVRQGEVRAVHPARPHEVAADQEVGFHRENSLP